MLRVRNECATLVVELVPHSMEMDDVAAVDLHRLRKSLDDVLLEELQLRVVIALPFLYLIARKLNIGALIRVKVQIRGDGKLDRVVVADERHAQVEAATTFAMLLAVFQQLIGGDLPRF